MKANMNVNTPKAKGATNSNRAENKDNLDSRKNEEYDVKGDDTTHNKKEHKSAKKKTED